jgi:ribosomal protein S12 methylthiotransferase accessory factor
MEKIRLILSPDLLKGKFPKTSQFKGGHPMAVEVRLQDAFKGYKQDQDKIIPPEETVRRFKDRLAALDLDILRQTVRIDNGRLGIPVFFSVCGQDAARVIGTKKQMGKGATPAQAEASAVMELAERFSFFSFVGNPANFVVDTYLNLKDEKMPFEMLARSVHDDSRELELAERIFEKIPLQWTRAFNLTRQSEILIPFNWFYAINAFNGPCAGNCVEEALSQGICEIVERHTSSLVSRQHLQLPAIDPDSVTEPLVVEMLQKYRQAGVRLYITDFSLGMGIPSVGVLAYDPATFPAQSEIVWTAGTTPDPQKALSRALTETAQLAGDFNSGSNYVASGLPKLKDLQATEFITHASESLAIQALPDIADDNIRVEVENLVSALAARQMEVIIVNTTHPGLRIPAFYTIVPGAHFRERALNTSVGLFASKLLSETLPPREALAQLMEVERRLPGKYYTSFYLGNCHLNLNDPQSAQAHFREALRREPTPQDAASICSYLGVSLKEMGKYRDALTVLRQGAGFDDERTDIYNLMGFCHYQLKEHAAAIECFKKVIELDPSSAIDYANIGSNYREMGNTQEAVRYYMLALELDPAIEFAAEALKRLMASEE